MLYRSLIHSTAAGALGFSLVACSTLPVTTDTNPNMSVTNCHTYAFAQEHVANGDQPAAYGNPLNAERLRVATGITLAPPFRTLWTFRARSLVEFPPVVAYGHLFFADRFFGCGSRGRRCSSTSEASLSCPMCVTPATRSRSGRSRVITTSSTRRSCKSTTRWWRTPRG